VSHQSEYPQNRPTKINFKDVAPLENGLFNFPESLYERSTTCAYAKSKIKWEAPGEISEISPSSLTTPPKF